jgi:integrase
MSLRFARLTRSNIRHLKPGARITEHGITAERTRDGDLRYSVNIMVDGHRVHRVIGFQSDGTTRTQGEAFMARVRSDAAAGRLSLPKGRKTQLTFAHGAEDYLRRLGDTDGRNVVAKQRQLRLYLTPFFGNQRLDSVSTFTVDRYKKRRQADGASNGTINLELATLSHLFNKAVEWGWLEARPCRIVKLAQSPGRIIALTHEQGAALMEAAVADADPDCWLFVMFGLHTAMRHAEILRARFDELDLENRRLFVPVAKAGQREQPITKALAETLRRECEMRADPAGWIFPSPRPSATLTGHRYRMDAPFRRAVIAAGLDPKVVTPHVMRHTAITKLVQAGVDIPTIQRISGHKSVEMVLRYTHVHGAHIDRAMDAIDVELEPTANKKPGTATHRLHVVRKRPA